MEQMFVILMKSKIDQFSFLWIMLLTFLKKLSCLFLNGRNSFYIQDLSSLLNICIESTSPRACLIFFFF